MVAAPFAAYGQFGGHDGSSRTGVMSMSRQPSDRIAKAERFRTLSRGYKALKKERATVYQAAAEALELIEERTNRDKAAIKERLREPELIRE